MSGPGRAKEDGIGRTGGLLTNNRAAKSLQRSVWRTTLTRSVRSTLKNATQAIRREKRIMRIGISPNFGKIAALRGRAKIQCPPTLAKNDEAAFSIFA